MDNHGIIAHSPTIPADRTTLAHRMVIRDQGNQFVVHMQVFEASGTTSFCHGNYFLKSNAAESVAMSDREALGKAWAAFERRSRRILGMKETGES
jgi:hypothetical protein